MPHDSPERERPEGRRTHEIRVAESESAFRRVNEAIEAGAPPGRGGIAFMCECGRLGCSAIVALSREDYEAVRTDFHRFLLLPGHQDVDVDEVTEDHGHYLVVVKTGPAGEIAAATDPRADGQPR